MRWLLSTVLVVAAGLFAIGVSNEGDAHQERATATASVHDEPAEAGEHSEAKERTEETADNKHEESEDTSILLINLESAPLVVGAVALSLALAIATWRTDRKFVLLVTAVFAAGFAALDVAELSHQIEESATTIAAIAGAVAVLHAAAALLAEQRRSAAV